MATPFTSNDPPPKRARLSYNGYSHSNAPPRDRRAEPSIYSGQPLAKELEAAKPKWIWTFSKNILEGLVEGSKTAVEGLKAVGSFLLGQRVPWPTDENNEFDEEEYVQTALPGEKRKRNPFAPEQQALSNSQTSMTAPTTASHRDSLLPSDPDFFPNPIRSSEKSHVSSPKRRNMFQTPWTDATQKEALEIVAIGSTTLLTNPRPLSRNGNRSSFSQTSSPTKFRNSFDTEQSLVGILEVSFNEEWGAGEAVLAADPDRLTESQDTRSSRSHIPSELSTVSNSDSFFSVSAFSSHVAASDQMDDDMADAFTAAVSDRELTPLPAAATMREATEPIAGHVETAKGALNVQDGELFDAFDIKPSQIGILAEDMVENRGEDEEDEDLNPSYDDEDEDDEEEESGDEDVEEDDEGDDVIEVGSSSEEEEEEEDSEVSDESVGIAEESLQQFVPLSSGASRPLIIESTSTPSVSIGNIDTLLAPDVAESFAEYAEFFQQTQQPTVVDDEDLDVIPSSLSSNSDSNKQQSSCQEASISIDFVTIDDGLGDGGEMASAAVVSNVHLEAAAFQEPDNSSQFDTDFEDHPDVLLADEQEQWEEDEDDGVDGENPDGMEGEEDGSGEEDEDESNAQDDSEIICDGVFGSQVAMQEENEEEVDENGEEEEEEEDDSDMENDDENADPGQDMVTIPDDDDE
ncbi:hypothetical protein BV898_07511 [Hypsibius exemplaris]|uniref:Uncharacterized protein n=1 Tax=Hypsibius exemplaris TaxID=2072580 RepID=A0A1W0WTG8_HYPEX|nr:hypothetical protein BV898_07511 [Hypsibius exemplaris]